MRKGEIACHNVFYTYLVIVRQNTALCGNEDILKTLLEKDKMLVTNIYAFQHCFLSFPKQLSIYQPHFMSSLGNTFNLNKSYNSSLVKIEI